ncbi:MAG: ATP-binding protein [Halovenus sp.]
MDDDYDIELIRRRSQSHREKAEKARRTGNQAEAARQYRNAAEAYEKLGTQTGVDYDDLVRDLRDAAALGDEGALSTTDRESTGHSTVDGEVGETTGTGSGQTETTGKHRSRVEDFICQTGVQWNDIGGLSATKRRIRRNLVLGSMEDTPPFITAGDRLLLFGPPGTGKTMLAKALAGATDATFFNVKLGGLLSMYHGETSKHVNALFDVAAELAPSIVFLDEIDALTQTRDAGPDATTRRVLNSLLSELDGVDDRDGLVYVVGATNTPWSLDQAIRRRFGDRVHVPLPDCTAAAQIVRIHTTHRGAEFAGTPADFRPSTRTSSECDVTETIAARCVERGFSGSDVAALCRAMVSHMLDRTNPDLHALADRSLKHLDSTVLSLDALRPDDVSVAFEEVSASLAEVDLQRYAKWDQQFGTTLTTSGEQ